MHAGVSAGSHFVWNLYGSYWNSVLDSFELPSIKIFEQRPVLGDRGSSRLDWGSPILTLGCDRALTLKGLVRAAMMALRRRELEGVGALAATRPPARRTAVGAVSTVRGRTGVRR